MYLRERSNIITERKTRNGGSEGCGRGRNNNTRYWPSDRRVTSEGEIGEAALYLAVPLFGVRGSARPPALDALLLERSALNSCLPTII